MNEHAGWTVAVFRIGRARPLGVAMNLTVRIFGLELLSIHASTDTDEQDDTSRDLSGGDLAGRDMDAGTPDTWFGFTGGRET